MVVQLRFRVFQKMCELKLTVLLLFELWLFGNLNLRQLFPFGING